MATRAGRARAGAATRSILKLGMLHLSCDREFGLWGRHFNGPFSCYCRRCHFNGPFSCYCRSCGPFFIRLNQSMETTAHEDQGEDKTDDHAGDGTDDDDTHRAARLGCQCTGQLTGQYERHGLRWRWCRRWGRRDGCDGGRHHDREHDDRDAGDAREHEGCAARAARCAGHRRLHRGCRRWGRLDSHPDNDAGRQYGQLDGRWVDARPGRDRVLHLGPHIRGERGDIAVEQKG